MDAITLKKKWRSISQSRVINGFESIRIGSKCFADVYIGVCAQKKRNLILVLPKLNDVDIKIFDKDKITLELIHESNLLVLKLEDDEYFDLFDDLVVSLYNAIKDIKDVANYSKVFINTFFKWSNFFELSKYEKMTIATLQGLWGELFILNSLLIESKAYEVDYYLDSWKGPFDSNHDFIFDEKNLEVKTKLKSKLTVNISSEYQLEPEMGKGLDLVVVTVDLDAVNGLSLSELLQEIKDHISSSLGDYSIVLNALIQKGITFKNIFDYDNFRFKPLGIVTYNCIDPDFPKLCKGNIPYAIESIKYKLHTSKLKEFITVEKVFSEC
jgi:hypothetical protein